MANKYFLKVDGIFGSSTDAQHAREFVVDGYEFDLTALMSAASGGGGGSFKATFSPLVLDMAASPGLVDLLAKAAAGQHIPNVTFSVVKPGERGGTVETIKLKDVTVVGYEERAGFDTRVVLNYSQIEVDIREQRPDGTLGAHHTFQYDLRASGNTITPVTEADLTPAVAATQTLDYFLKVDGIFGSSTDDRHAREFDVDGYEFDLTALMSATSGGGGGASKAVFSPLVLDMAASPGLADLLAKAAAGEHIANVTFSVVKPGDRGGTIETIKLKDVTVVGFEERSGFDTRVVLNYSQIEVDVQEQKPDGTLGAHHTFQYDLRATGNTITPVTEADLTSTVAATQTFDYFLKVDGIFGSATSAQHAREFVVDGYEFDLTALMSAASGGGGGASKAVFSPLVLDMAASSGLVDLLAKAATGQHIPNVTFSVVKPGERGGTVETVKLKDVTVVGYEERSGFDTRVVLNYSQIEVDIREQRPDGTLGPHHTFQYDLKAQGNTITPVTEADLTPAVATTQTFDYFLKVDGIFGSATNAQHAREFVVDGYEFDLTALMSAASGGGGGASKAVFSPLVLDMAASSGLVDLLAKAATGQHIPNVTFSVVKPGERGGTVETVKLKDVTVVGYEERSGFDTRVVLNYSQIEVDIREQRPDGTLGAHHTFQYDLRATGNTITPVTEADLTSAVAATQTFDYFLKVDGIFGSATNAQHAREFVVDGYEFDLTALMSATSGGGGGSKPVFSPLVLDMAASPGLVELLAKAASGQHISNVTFSVVKPGERGGTVETIKLKDVTVVGYDEHSDGDTRIILNYRDIAIDIREQRPDGTLGPHHTFGSGINDGPVAVDDTAFASTGIGGTASGNVLTNDSDTNGDTLTAVAGAFDGSHGTLNLNADGSYGYTVTDLTGATGQHLHDVFSYTADDGHGGTASASLDITLNRGPTAVNDTASAPTGIGGTASGNILSNDSDPDGDTLAAKAGSYQGSHGTWDLNADGSYTYTVTDDLTGPIGQHLHDVFTYTANDGHSGTASALLDITLNRAPIAVEDAASASTGIGGTVSGDVLANDSDPDGDTLAAAAGTFQGAHGTLNIHSNGSYDYTVTDLTGPTGQHLHDVFSYTANDVYGGTASALLDITLNRASVAVADANGTGVGAIVAGNVLTNDSDPDGDSLLVTGIGGGNVGQTVSGAYGTLLLNADGSYTYAANAKVSFGNYPVVQDSFTYTESDGHGGTSDGTLTVTITPKGQDYVLGTPGTDADHLATFSTGNGKGVLDASLGYQNVNGGNGKDVLIGGHGDILTGGNGDDTYVFMGEFGHNEITDFSPHKESIQLSHNVFANFAAVMQNASYSQADDATTITAGSHGTIVLDHVNLTALHASNFLFA